MKLDKPGTLATLHSEPTRLKSWTLAALVAILCLSLSPATALAKDTHPKLMLSKMVNTQDYKCLNRLIIIESSWDVSAISATHDYGLPQRHMTHHTSKQIKSWITNPYAQLRWMITYTHTRYGSPCAALKAHTIKGWY